ncbi:MAG TPA: F0F1 ATP synthase subunit epsilon [Acidobacteriota bacterium]|nr:F0F1 ATP synthase subunit epsilon [Acidobacteriota bacterium]
MRLKLLIPSRVVVDEEVSKIVAEGKHGSFCLLPRHVDFLAALVPGLLFFDDQAGEECIVAIDEGVLVKQGRNVLVSTRQAIRGTNLEQMQNTVREEFALMSDRERAANAAVAKLEASFLRGYLELTERER